MKPWVLQERVGRLWFDAVAPRRFATQVAAIAAAVNAEAYSYRTRRLRVILWPATGSGYTYSDHRHGEVVFERRVIASKPK